MNTARSTSGPGRFQFENFLQYRYSYLFIAIILILAVMPVVERTQTILVPVFFFVVMFAVLGTLNLSRRVYRICLGLAVVIFLMMFYTRWGGFSLSETFGLDLIASGCFALFLSISITVLIKNIFSEERVTADTIKGGIAVYFLMGILWSSLYHVLLLYDPQAINLSGSIGQNNNDLLYFSFTTLTTLGYGDITPLSYMARILTILEATFGQVYMTVLIARLVGLHLSISKK